jgi:hypothetical protein
MTTRVDGCDTVLYAYPRKRTMLRNYSAFLPKRGPRLAVHPVQTLPLRASTPTRAGVEVHSIRAASQTTPTRQRDRVLRPPQRFPPPPEGGFIGPWFQPYTRRHCDPCGPLQTSPLGGVTIGSVAGLFSRQEHRQNRLIPIVNRTVRSGKLPSGPSIR